MLLSVKDRLVLNGLVPKMIPSVASRALYCQIDDLGRQLSFTDEELTTAGVVFGEEGSVSWNADDAREKEVEISASLLKLITEGFKRMDSSGDLPRDALSVFDKFVPTEEWAKEKD